MYGLHGRWITAERMQIETTQMDMVKAYQKWEKEGGKEKADESKAKFTEVEYLPEKDEAQLALGKKATLYLNSKTKATWYEYTDRPMENASALVAQINELTATVATLSKKIDAIEAKRVGK